MKVCQVTSMHPWNDDRIYQRTCGALVREGIDTELVATKDEMYASEQLDVRMHFLPKREGWRRRLISSFEAYNIARQSDADIVHFHDPDLIPWMLLLAISGRNVVYDVHENHVSRFANWGVPPRIARIARALYRASERLAVRRFSGVVAVTDSIAEIYQGAAHRSLVLHNVVDIERLSHISLSAEKCDRPLIVSTGTHSDARNALQTVRALPSIVRSVPDVLMCFGGAYVPDGFDQQLLQLARDLGVQDNLKVRGMLPWEENFVETSKAHVGCMFYANNENNKVGLANRIFEYMFCGVAVLADDFPELRRVVDGTGCGLLIDSNSPESIADAAVELLSKPDLAREMGRKGRSAVLKRYNFGTELKGLISMYEEILA